MPTKTFEEKLNNPENQEELFLTLFNKIACITNASFLELGTEEWEDMAQQLSEQFVIEKKDNTIIKNQGNTQKAIQAKDQN